MSINSIPEGPWHNPLLPDSHYHALIHDVERHEYRNGFYYRIVLWLADESQFIVSNIYVKRGCEQSAKKRVWHFAEACYATLDFFPRRLIELRGRTIQVALRTTTPGKDSKSKAPYSDVREFFPPQRSLTPQQRQEYEAAQTPTPKSRTHISVQPENDFYELEL